MPFQEVTKSEMLCELREIIYSDSLRAEPNGYRFSGSEVMLGDFVAVLTSVGMDWKHFQV